MLLRISAKNIPQIIIWQDNFLFCVLSKTGSIKLRQIFGVYLYV